LIRVVLGGFWEIRVRVCKEEDGEERRGNVGFRKRKKMRK